MKVIKKALQLISIPVIDIAVVYAISFGLMMSEGIPFTNTIALLIYIIPAGLAYARIDSKGIRIASIILTAALYIGCAIGAQALWDYTDMAGFYGLFTMPLTYTFELMIPTDILRGIVSVAIAPAPIIINILAGKMFDTDNKIAQKVIAIVLAILCVTSIVFGIRGMIMEKEISDYESEYYYDDGCYYDQRGNEYSAPDDVIYYDKAGNQYHTEIETNDEYDCYDYYLCNQDGQKYEYDLIYIDGNGYVFIDEKDEMNIAMDGEELSENEVWCYYDNDGNIYASIYGIDYDKNGKPYDVFNGDHCPQ